MALFSRSPSPSRSGPALTRPTQCDVLYLSDLRFAGGTSSSLVNEIRAAVSAGFRIGVMQLASSSLRSDRPFHEDLRALIDSGQITLVPHNQTINATLTIIKHPTLFTESLEGELGITTDHLLLVIGQVPIDPDGRRHYEAAAVNTHIAEAMGRAPIWAPVSPMVRDALLAEAGSQNLHLMTNDWVEIIDVDAWARPRPPLTQGPLVIGRHSRDDRAKWPDTAAEILDLYPDSPDQPVRILGGISSLVDVLPAVPTHWEVHQFGSMAPMEFLAGVDVYLYFHSSGLVEAFGRSTLEALASGAICVLPPHFEPLFGEACLYGEPAQVPELLNRIRNDPNWCEEIRIRSTAVVRDRFSYAAHRARLAEFVPRPGRWDESSPTWFSVAARVRDQRPGILFSALGASASEVTALVNRVGQLRNHSDGIRPVIAATVAAPPQAAALGVVVEVITSRANYSGPATEWPAYAQKRLRGIMRNHHLTRVMVTDLFHEDAWIALRVTGDNS